MRPFTSFALAIAGIAALGALPVMADKEAATPPTTQASTTYDVVHTLDVRRLPEGAEQVRIWFWMPEDRPGQQVLDFRMTEAPDSARVTRDPEYGRSWVHADVDLSNDESPRIETRFRLRRESLTGLADAKRATPVTEAHRRTFADALKRDEVHMEVTLELQSLADELCGDEENPVVQARRIFEHIVEVTDHYSVAGSAPEGQCLGDATLCLAGTGDCCTDQHALFIALCRARGIPCRLVFGSRLQPQNSGKAHDPGYRCWPVFFAPGLGWVPVDVSAADAADARPERWFGGLDDRRVEWAEGRDLELSPASNVRPDLVIRAWVEVDGKPFHGFTRTVLFHELVD